MRCSAISADGLNLAAGLRIDDHSRFGSQWTFGANGSFAVADGWRIRASYGEGFKAPTLFQLFSDFGNSRSFPNAAAAMISASRRATAMARCICALTAFRRDSRDLIDFVSCFGVSTASAPAARSALTTMSRRPAPRASRRSWAAR